MSDTNEQVQEPEKKEDEAQEQPLPKRKRYQKRLKSEIIEVEMENGEIKEFEIREMMQGEKEAWQMEMRGRMAFTKEGKPMGLKDFKQYAGNLLMRCCYDVATGKKVSIAYFTNWGTTTVEGMWADAARINGLDRDEKESEEEAKKD